MEMNNVLKKIERIRKNVEKRLAFIFSKNLKMVKKKEDLPMIDVDKECHSIFIILEKSKIKESESYDISGIWLIVDRDKKGRVVALEILY